MIEILNFIVGLVFTIFAFLFMIGSAVLVHEKKQRQKAGITDYYDNPIKKDGWTFNMESINSYLARLWTSCNKRVYKSPIKIGD